MSSLNSLNYCPNCGTKIIPQAKFCMECGYEIEKLKKLLNENEISLTGEMDIENIIEEKTPVSDTSEDYPNEKINQPLIEDVNPVQENQEMEEDHPDETINDFELVRPDLNDTGMVNNDYSEQEDKIDDEPIRIMQTDDESNDFDIIRPDIHKNDKKQKKDFSILNKKD